MSGSGISLRNHRRLAEESSDASVEAASANSNASSSISASRPSSAVYLSFAQKEQFSSKELVGIFLQTTFQSFSFFLKIFLKLQSILFSSPQILEFYLYLQIELRVLDEV